MRMGAEDVRTIDLPKNVNFDTITQFVVATSRSTRLLRKMADTIVHALQERRLDKAPGATGPEGDLDDDWLIVDCWTIAVHIMLPTARKSLNLEALWDGSTPRPALRPVRNEMDYDEVSHSFNIAASSSRFRSLMHIHPHSLLTLYSLFTHSLLTHSLFTHSLRPSMCR